MALRKNLIEFRKEILNAQAAMADDLVIRDAGLTVHTRCDGITLSPGCEACKRGRWLCAFVGRQCNARCANCPQEITPDLVDYADSFVGMWMHDAVIYADLFQGEYIEGLSYSGGEPLMYLDKIEKVASQVRDASPNVFQWIYTNGILIDEDKLKRLRDIGISEIRFNLTATHYKKKVMSRLELASKFIDRVTVEVPSIPETWKQLIELGKIQTLVDSGVSQLNLAELYLLTPKAWSTWGHEELYRYSSNFYRADSPVFSRRITCAIMKHVIDNRIRILVNDCSNDTKHLQVVKRNLNPLLRQSAKAPN